MIKKNIIFLLMSGLCVASNCFSSQEEVVVVPVAEQLQLRQTNWRPKVTVYHPGGAPETVIFFEDKDRSMSKISFIRYDSPLPML